MWFVLFLQRTPYMTCALDAQHTLLHKEVTQSVMLIFSEGGGDGFHVGGDKLWAGTHDECVGFLCCLYVGKCMYTVCFILIAIIGIKWFQRFLACEELLTSSSSLNSVCLSGERCSCRGRRSREDQLSDVWQTWAQTEGKPLLLLAEIRIRTAIKRDRKHWAAVGTLKDDFLFYCKHLSLQHFLNTYANYTPKGKHFLVSFNSPKRERAHTQAFTDLSAYTKLGLYFLSNLTGQFNVCFWSEVHKTWRLFWFFKCHWFSHLLIETKGTQGEELAELSLPGAGQMAWWHHKHAMVAPKCLMGCPRGDHWQS